ncbi:hypothetical protein GCM10009827_082600 [Dactylosporangium maewongense]|uniref:Phage holin family protein n=1 Tax=Dactylosporangium maewongense TaxID=634393 RepID=A0ABN2C137_9ACTN
MQQLTASRSGLTAVGACSVQPAGANGEGRWLDSMGHGGRRAPDAARMRGSRRLAPKARGKRSVAGGASAASIGVRVRIPAGTRRAGGGAEAQRSGGKPRRDPPRSGGAEVQRRKYSGAASTTLVGRGTITRMGILIRLGVSAFTVWLATLVIPGITVGGTTGRTVLTVLVVAAIFGIVNAVLRPIIKTIGCWAYLLTLGLISLVVNGLLLMLTSWIAEQLDLAFHVENFWPSAVLGALFIGIVSWVINLVIPDGGDKDRNQRRQPPPSRQQQYYPRNYR